MNLVACRQIVLLAQKRVAALRRAATIPAREVCSRNSPRPGNHCTPVLCSAQLCLSVARSGVEGKPCRSVYEVCVQRRLIGVTALVLVFLRAAYANGGHMHVEGMFFLLLGGLIFLGGLCVVVYFLLRPHPEVADEPHDQD
jgi:hypothetical protein